MKFPQYFKHKTENNIKKVTSEISGAELIYSIGDSGETFYFEFNSLCPYEVDWVLRKDPGNYSPTTQAEWDEARANYLEAIKTTLAKID